MKPILTGLLTLFCALGAALLQGTAMAQTQPLSMMVVPQFPDTRINASWGPVLAAVGKDIGQPIELRFVPDIPSFERAFEAGTPDLIYCNPFHVVMAKRSQSYIAVLRDQQLLKGLLLVLADSPYQSLKDLEGQTLLFPAPNAFGASLYMRAILTEKEKLQFTPKYVKTHPNVIRGLIRKEGAAGGMVQATLSAEDDKLEARTRVLFETPPTAPHAIAIHPRIDEARRKAIVAAFKKALLGMPKEAELIPLTQPIDVNYKRDYLAVEQLNLDKYATK